MSKTSNWQFFRDTGERIELAPDSGEIDKYDGAGAAGDIILANNGGNVGVGKAPAEKLDVDGNVAISGTLTVDGVEVTGGGGGGGSMTNSEVKTAYEANADTNAFTDADETKLDGIEAGADVTPAWVPESDPGYLTSHQDISGKLDTTGGTITGDLELSSTSAKLVFNETDTDPDFQMLANAGQLRIQNETAGANLMIIEASRNRSITRFDAEGGLVVTGSSTLNGNVALDGDVNIQDGHKINLGNSTDLQLSHGGGISEIKTITGDLVIANTTPEEQLKLRAAGTSGGAVDYAALNEKMMEEQQQQKEQQEPAASVPIIIDDSDSKDDPVDAENMEEDDEDDMDADEEDEEELADA
mgnify:CR=1 FL=1